MSDIKQFEPLWGVWRIEKLIGEGSYGKVYRASREEFGNMYYSAIKHITIPKSEDQITEAISEGIPDNKEALREYFDDIVNNLINEISLMDEVKGNSHIVSYEDHMIVPNDTGIGYDIFIRMELLTGLNDVLRHRQFTNVDVIKLGIDLCSALEVCMEKGIIHRDIKPSNIFVNDLGEYKLGDFGVARQLEHTTAGMSKKGTYVYMAPEVYRGEPASFSADTFSLGIVMYRLLNGNRAPFLPVGSEKIKSGDNEIALARRMGGEPLPAPAFSDKDLAEIILKATQYKREDRFSSPTEFKNALLSLQYKPDTGHTVPVLSNPTGNSSSSFSEKTNTNETEDIITKASENVETENALISDDKTELAPIPSETKSTKRRNTIIKTISACVAAIGLIVFSVVFLLNYIVIGGKIIKKDVTELDLSNYNIKHISQLSQCKELKYLDLRGNDIAMEDLTALKDRLPNCNILYSVDISGISVDSSVKELDLSNKDIYDYSNLIYLIDLKKLCLTNTGLSYDELIDIQEMLPNCSVLWDITLYGNNYSCDSTNLDLSELNVSNPSDLINNIKYFKNVKTIDLSGSAMDNDSLLKLAENLGIEIIWTIPLYGTSYRTDIINMDLSASKIDTIDDLRKNISYFTKLKSIDLSSCNIDNDILYNFRKECSPISVIWTVNISGDTYKTNIDILDLSYYRLNDIHVLKYFDSIKTLNLRNCRATDFSVISELKTLIDLDLFGTSVSDIRFVEELTKLEHLNIGMTNVSDLSHLSKLPALKQLMIGYCRRINNLSPLAEVKSLESLWMHELRTTDLSPLYELPKLRDINILYTSSTILPKIISELEKLPHLNSLIISMGSLDVSLLGNLKGLIYLDIECNQLTDKGIEALCGLSSLNSLFIRCNNLTDDNVNTLRNALPKCKVNDYGWN